MVFWKASFFLFVFILASQSLSIVNNDKDEEAGLRKIMENLKARLWRLGSNKEPLK